MIDTATSTSHTLTGLAGNTEYDVYVAKYCGPTDGASDWTNLGCFKTECGPFVAPFTETFENAVVGSSANPSPPDCWTFYETPGAPGYGYTRNLSGYARSGSQFFYMYNSTNKTNGDTMAIVSPGVDGMDVVDKRIEFWARNYYSGTTYDVQLIVGTVNSPQEMNTFVPIDTFEIGDNINYQYCVSYITAANGYNGTHKYIVIMDNSDVTDYPMIDDISISDVPNCIPSTNLTVGTISNNSADLSWLAGQGLAYNIEYGPTGFTQGTGPVITGITGTNYTLTGLAGNTCYDVYVRDSCANGKSPWFGPINFCTACNAQPTPILEGFESTSGGSSVDPQMPSCWSYWSSNPSSYGYTYSSIAPIGTRHFRMYNLTGNSDTLAIISPAVQGITNGDKMLSFNAKSSTSTYNTLAIVGTTPSISDLRNATFLDTFVIDGASYDTRFVQHLDASSGYNGTDEYVFLMHGNSALYTLVFFDDIAIEDIPQCGNPWNLNASNITASSAQGTWTSLYGTNFRMEYGPQGFIPGTGGTGTVIHTSNKSYNMGSLSPNTFYDFYVSDMCDSLNFAGPFTFKTDCVSQLSGTYTVGGASADFATLDSAMAVLSGCGISGPVTFNLQGGTHAAFSLGQISGASATNTVTINGSANFGDSIVAGSGQSSAINLDGTSYVTFNDLYIQNEGGIFVIWLHNSSSYITFDGCDIVGSLTTTATSAVIAASALETSIASYGDNTSHFKLLNSSVRGNYYGVSLNGLSTSSKAKDLEFTNNTFEDVFYYGLRTYYADSVIVQGNTFPNGLRNTASYALYMYYTDNAQVLGNAIYNANTSAFNFGYTNYSDATPGSYSIVANNMLQCNGTYGMYLYYPVNVDLHNNSIVGGTTYGFYCTGSATLTQDVDIRNNILVNSGSGTACFIGTAPANTTVDYNLYSSGGNIGNLQATLAAWKVAMPTWNQNSIENIPGFAAIDDLHIVGTAPNDVGDNSVGLTTDIDGDIRPASGSTTIDIGADEYSPLNYDVNAVGIVEPTNLICGDSNTVVKVVISNYGLQAASNITVEVNVTGSTTASMTASYAGPLASLGVDTVTVSSFNSAAGGTFNIEAVVNFANDQDHSNDTTTTSVMINDILVRTPIAAIDSVCAGQFDTLFFPPNTANMGFQWLTTNGDTIGSTDSLVVGPLTSNDTTFILNPTSSSSYVGPVDNSIGASANYTAMNHYLEFTVFNQTNIISVDVVATGAGLVDVLIQDGVTLATLYTHTVAVPAGGIQTLLLNQPLAPGTYRMGGTTVNNAGGLQRNSAGAMYPYVSADGSVSITGNTFGATYYYFFYNWKIGTGGCPRPDGEVTIYNGGSVTPAFTETPQTPTQVDLTVNFDASSTAGVVNTYDWDFGDGNTGTGVTTSHTYTANGTYTVVLTVDGPCGMYTVSKQVVIMGIGLEETLIDQTFNVYPNPNNGNFRIQFQVEGLKDVTIRVLNLMGQQMYENKPGNISGEYQQEINLGNQSAGVYVIQIVSEDGVSSKRITIQK